MPHKLLLCDDELHILRAAEFKFRRAGFDVRCAVDGQEGWELIQEEPPDLLITDYQMPRLDGLGLIERVRSCEATREMPVIMLSAKGFELSSEELTERYGVTEIVHKPFSPRELLKNAQELLESPSVTEANATS